MKKNGKLGLIGRKRKMDEKSKDDENENEEQIIKKEKILCQICKTQEYKYNCPRCLFKTCSVKCVKAHKSKYGCDGEKDKFGHVSKQEDYNEKIFHRDVHFLNSAINDINMSNKKIYNLTEDTLDFDKNSSKSFKRILKKFRDINYIKSPIIMDCHKINKSYLDQANKKVFWTIKFNFIDDNLIYIFDKTFDSDETNINKLIEYINSNKQSVKDNNVGLLNIIKDKEWCKNYEFCLKMDTFELTFEQKKNYFFYKKYYYFICDLETTINELLKGKKVYEFPEFYLIKKSMN